MSRLSLVRNRRWDPFHEMNTLNNQLSELFFGNSGTSAFSRNGSVSEWVPLVDVIEGDEGYVIKADLPEVSKKDISVKVEEGVLTISGERQAEKVSDERKVHRVERPYGKFIRSFRLSENLDTEKVAAGFKDGVLRVTLPKLPEAKPQAIEVAVA